MTGVTLGNEPFYPTVLGTALCFLVESKTGNSWGEEDILDQ